MLALKHKEMLKDLKKYVEQWYMYFKSNNQRFWECTKFVAATTLSQAERTALQALSKPQLEFNILPAMLSRLLGEFAKHAPSIEVRAADGVPIHVLTDEFLQTIDIIEGHMRAIFNDSTNDSLKYRFYADLLRGGFSVGEVITEYVNPRSFEQVIKVQRVFDPTMCFFDPLARLSHKGDGQYCGKITPLTKEDFEAEFGKERSDKIKENFDQNIEGFKWSYKNQDKDIILIATCFVKQFKKVKIVKLSNGHVVPKRQYEMLKTLWEKERVLEAIPIILDERWTFDEVIDVYKFCGDEVLSHEETNFKMLPLVFIDGDSVLIRGTGTSTTGTTGSDVSDSDEGGEVQQFTRPYILHAKDMQKLVNFAGQTLANELESVIQHQWKVPIEAIPEDYIEAYKNPQLASVLAYNQLYDKDPNIQLNPPEIIQRREIPPIIQSTFNSGVQHIQALLGTYEASLGINDKQLSGVAIQQGALQSNAASLPYLVGFTNGLSRFAEIVLDLIPKYYRTPRTLPVLKSDGKRSYQIINKDDEPQSIRMDYDPNNLQIKLEIGVSAAVQKQASMEMINQAMAANPAFADFMTKMGLEIYIDNMDLRKVDHLKELAAKYMQMTAEQAEQQAQQPTDAELLAQTEKEIAMADIEQRKERAEGEQVNKATELAIKKQESDMKFLELLAKIESEDQKKVIERERIDAENARDAVEMAISIANSIRE